MFSSVVAVGFVFVLRVQVVEAAGEGFEGVLLRGEAGCAVGGEGGEGGRDARERVFVGGDVKLGGCFGD
jgi:hypothetical protein